MLRHLPDLADVSLRDRREQPRTEKTRMLPVRPCVTARTPDAS